MVLRAKPRGDWKNTHLHRFDKRGSTFKGEFGPYILNKVKIRGLKILKKAEVAVLIDSQMLKSITYM